MTKVIIPLHEYEELKHDLKVYKESYKQCIAYSQVYSFGVIRTTFYAKEPFDDKIQSYFDDSIALSKIPMWIRRIFKAV